MNDKMALNLIAEVMGWAESDESTATQEYAWLRLMSAVKYDTYGDFRAGARFIESLANWLKQFAPADRQTAYDFVKNRLIYISPAELRRVIEAFIPETVTPMLRHQVAAELGIKPYEVWATPQSVERFDNRLRRTLLVGLSDGSRIDILRRADRRISQEQVVPMMYIDDEKWRGLQEDLTTEEGAGAKFDNVYLIDDFTASGTTFIRKEADGRWKGKLTKFNALVAKAGKRLGDDFPIANGYDLHIHHYISSYQARQALNQRLAQAEAEWEAKSYGRYTITEGLLLPSSAQLTATTDPGILGLCDRYYDRALFDRLQKHCPGQTHLRRGYAECALPVVMEHNTPNNSISLLWAETSGEAGRHRMRPLFHRRDRHG
ncbi:MAG TPA: hypothetical protein VF688_11160 [Allosphingosinicella sp.]|jgi:hypothetical protein